MLLAVKKGFLSTAVSGRFQQLRKNEDFKYRYIIPENLENTRY